MAQAVYGLPEVNREQIKTAQLIANPGCYPTAVQLGFLPLLEAGMVDERYLIADAKSGVSGAGRKAEVGTLFAEAGDNFKAYAASGHRHLPEISQGLTRYAGKPVGLTFVPHLTPLIRGIHATLYARLTSFATTLDVYHDIKSSRIVSQLQWLTHHHATGFTRKILVDRLVVHNNIALARLDEHPCH